MGETRLGKWQRPLEQQALNRQDAKVLPGFLI